MIKHTNKEAAFTLIELLVVVTILAILAVAGMASYSGIASRARDSRRASDINQIKKAMEMYRIERGTFPALSALTCTGTSGGITTATATYMKAPFPCDPRTGNPYNIVSSSTAGFEFSASAVETSGTKITTYND